MKIDMQYLTIENPWDVPLVLFRNQICLYEAASFIFNNSWQTLDMYWCLSAIMNVYTASMIFCS